MAPRTAPRSRDVPGRARKGPSLLLVLGVALGVGMRQHCGVDGSAALWSAQGLPSTSEMDGAVATTLSMIDHLGVLADESFGSRAGTLLSDESEQLLGDELGLLLNESDALQRELVSSMHHQRLLTSLSEKERNTSGSWLQPLATVTRLAAEEAEGHRRAGTAETGPREPPPILVPERDVRDDVLALKSVLLLDTAASALHEALRTLHSTRALRTPVEDAELGEGGTLLTTSARQMSEMLEADAQPAMCAGLPGRRPMLAALVEEAAEREGMTPAALRTQMASQGARDPDPLRLDAAIDGLIRDRESTVCGMAGACEGESACGVWPGAGGGAQEEDSEHETPQDAMSSGASWPVRAAVPMPGGAAGRLRLRGGGRDGGADGGMAVELATVDVDMVQQAQDKDDAECVVSESVGSSAPFTWDVREPTATGGILAGLGGVKMDKVEAVRELMGVDVFADPPLPTHPSDNCAWYDSLDPLGSDEVDTWVNADGSLHLPRPENASRTPALDAEAAAAAAARAEANAELERQALAYMARKMTEQERLCVGVSSENARTRLAALRALAVREKTLQEQDAAEYDAACAERKKMTRAAWLRGKERAAEVKVLRHEMFKSGFSMIQRHLTMYYWDKYMTKQEAQEVLDRRDADPLYHDFVNKLMPLGLQNFAGPEATLQSWATLHSIYPDTPRKGGVDPAIVYNGDPCAEMLFDEDERKLGLNRDRNNPRNVVYPHGDWSTRIPGVHPIMPAVNSKVVRKALAAANETALRQIQLDRAAEEAEEQLLLRLRRERREELAGSAGDDAGGEGMGFESDTARRIAVVERWGCEDKEGLSMILWDLTVAAVLSNQSVQLEHLVGTHGPVWAHFEEEESVADNMTQLVRDGADVNMRQAEANGWTALHLAAAYGGAGVCEFLMANCSADPNVSSNNGGTPLHYAAYNGHAAVVRRLVKGGAALDARNHFAQTPLHVAATVAANGSAVALVELGADVLAKDEAGKTPRDLLQDNDWSGSQIAPTIVSPIDLQDHNASYVFLDAFLRAAESRANSMVL